MEGIMSDDEKRAIVSSFLEIAVGQTAETAMQFLQATNWKVEDAIQLFYVGNDGNAFPSASQLPSVDDTATFADQSTGGLKDTGSEHMGHNSGDEVRAPLPVVRETLYDGAMLYGASRLSNPQNEVAQLVAFRNFGQEMKRPGVWESEQATTSVSDASQDNLAALYRPPFHLMFLGSFDQAKSVASTQGKWLLVNLQSTKEFSSHMLNRDTWGNEAVSETINTNFIFWQIYEDTNEGRKVCTYYKLDSIPVVLVIDPITGQKMRAWCGMVQPESLLEDLVPFLDGGPRDHHAILSNKRPRGTSSSTTPEKAKVPVNESKKEVDENEVHKLKDSANKKEEAVATATPTPTAFTAAYPALPEEPKGDRNLMCRVGVRLPNGRRLQRNFLLSDPIQLLWSFCFSQLEDEGAASRSFRLTHAIPGASKTLDYAAELTFQASGLANSMISVTWD